MAKVLVTPRSLTKELHPALEKVKAAGHTVVTATPGEMPTKEELAELLPDCSGYLAGIEPITRNVLEKAKELKVISRNGVGIDNIDREAARQLGIAVETTPGANSRGVAELTVGMLFSLFRSIPGSNAVLKHGGWERKRGFEVADRTLGIIGCGNIGRLVADMTGNLGMKVLGYDLNQDRSFGSDCFTWSTLENVLFQSDVISLHCPPIETPIINHKTISEMKDGAFIINTARAELIDEEAVLEALECGKIAGYAADVFSKEPPGKNDLVDHPNVIATPHIGAYTKESVNRSAEEAVTNILKYL